MTTGSRTRCRWPTWIRRQASSAPPTRRPPRWRYDDGGHGSTIGAGSRGPGRRRGLLPRVRAERDLDRLATGHRRADGPVRRVPVRLLLPAVAELLGPVAGIRLHPPVAVDRHHDHALGRGVGRGALL